MVKVVDILDIKDVDVNEIYTIEGNYKFDIILMSNLKSQDGMITTFSHYDSPKSGLSISTYTRTDCTLLKDWVKPLIREIRFKKLLDAN